MEDYNSSLDYLNPYQDESEQLYQYYLRSAGDRYGVDTSMGLTTPSWIYGAALRDVVEQRTGHPLVTDPGDPLSLLSTPMSPRDPNNNPALANVDHALQSQKDWELTGPPTAMRPPVYQLLKLLAQRMPKASMIPAGLDAFGRSRMGQRLLQSDDEHPFTEASPPSWEQLMWGMRPIWGRN